MKKKFVLLLSILIVCIGVLTIYKSVEIDKLKFNEEERPITKLLDLSSAKKIKKEFVYYESSKEMDRNVLSELPKYSSGYLPFLIDLRSYDVSHFDLADYAKELNVSTYDTNTVWPVEIPSGFEPKKILEMGKNPGLGIRNLHERGITGKGVNVAIFDSALYQGHDSYKSNIITYEMINCLDDSVHMHGSLVTSIFVGDTIGVAPDAKVYYIAMTFGDYLETGPEKNLNYLVQGINRVLEINTHLPADEQIKVISISTGIDEGTKGYNSFISAVDQANDEGVFVLTCTPDTNFELRIGGLARDPMSNPNSIESYELGSLLTSRKFTTYESEIPFLLLPMDNRTYASFTGKRDYSYANIGGNSLLTPWIAGLYALCVQVDSDLTPNRFIELVYETADVVELEIKKSVSIEAYIPNPSNLILELSK